MAGMTSPRFAGIATLDACLAGTRTMPPNNGATPEPDRFAVGVVQRALVDLGYLRDYREVDFAFGGRTAHAVHRYKADRGIVPSDGVIGPKTSRALDEEFPAGTLSTGALAPFVASGRVDATIAGLVDVLATQFSTPWSSHVASFALNELNAGNLVGSVRASRAGDLKPLVPVSEHAEIDAVAAQLAAQPSTGGFTHFFLDGGSRRSLMIFNDALLDHAKPGDARHLGAVLAVTHELSHHRNRSVDAALRAEPVTATDFVDVAKADFFTTSSHLRSSDTRATFIGEVGVRFVAWQVYQELVRSHAGEMLATGVITRPAAVTELTVPLTRGQLFHSTLTFARDSVSPAVTYEDNGYMLDLTETASVAVFNRQVALWMRAANRMEFHDDPVLRDRMRGALTAEVDAHAPGFPTPGVASAGLIGF